MKFDLLVIGSGPAGYAASIKARRAGLSVCLVEKALAGGVCLNRGCIPTKALLYSSSLRLKAAEAALFGVHDTAIHDGADSFDFTKVQRRKLEVVDAIRANQIAFIEKSGVSLERGSARIENAGDEDKTVSITGDDGESVIVRAKRILIATGTKPALIPVAGCDVDGVFTSDDLLGDRGPLFERCFPKLTIIGGGVVGMEFASIYSNFGGDVTVIEALPRVLANMDREISQTLAMILKKRGVNIVTNARLEKIEKFEKTDAHGGGGLSCFFRIFSEGADAPETPPQSIASNAVLIAAGRKPETAGLFSPDCREAIALTERGYIRVNEAGMTSAAGVYAAGDIASGAAFGMSAGVQLAHTATAQAERIVDHIVGKMPAPLGAIPACVYTAPEIACAGLTDGEAKERGVPAVTGKGVFGGNGRAVIEHQERSFVKLVFHAETKALIGAQIMCNHATDIIAWAVQCINAGITAEQIRNSVFAHPTYAETIVQAAERV
ncbi:MAG: NAD(P)/FAD-dependent oxidoreductase [Treponema sp.]|jgi:dihydrolipoamide dehydrogenase|nr:NAD(P)/FAD-dependent oxidoreductase [Treponema sp.]